MSKFSVFFILVASLGMETLVLCQRPIYNIGHMVNSKMQIDTWLNKGSNALEADVKFDQDTGVPKHFYHGPLCDAGRDCERWAYIGPYVNALKARTKPSSPQFNRGFALMMFDCKLNGLKENLLQTAGKKFADDILIPLYQDNPTKMKVIISVPEFKQKNFISGVLSRLRSRQAGIVEKIGFEISWESTYTEPSQKEDQFKLLGVAPGHAWLSSGITNSIVNWNEDNVRKQVAYRDNGKYFSKAYTWSVDKTSTIKWYLNFNLDGIITNYPSHVNTAIEQINNERSEGKKIRLATLDDNPFEVYQN